MSDKVISSLKAKELIEKETENVSILLLVNPKHDEVVKSMFGSINNVSFINIFDGIEID